MRILDLFCCAGGAGMGYHRAGFEVVGVDIDPQPHYPFEFYQADAMAVLRGETSIDPSSFDAIHASPPCQAYSIASKAMREKGKVYPDLLDATRAALDALGKPYVIENVPGSPLHPDARLCGCMFGLRLRRERWFELSWHPMLMMPPHDHRGPVPLSVVGHGTPSWVRAKLGYNPSIADYRAAMGIDWMNRNELSQAIPPAYTEFIGGQLVDQLQAVAA